MNVTVVIMTILTDTDCVLTLDVAVMSHVMEMDRRQGAVDRWIFLSTG